jgi:tRNA (guanine-N7-)-methyltransferase
MSKIKPQISEMLRFYGRRKGRPLSQNMQRLLRDLLPGYQISEDSLTALNTAKTPLTSLFAEQAVTEVSLEIGFGGGEHLASLAKTRPDNGFIGAEPFINGVASLLRHIEFEQLQNIRIWPDDVRLILDRLPAQSLSCVYIMFPDPWPKSRHARRRIVNQDIMDKIARLLPSNGHLRMASDHPVAKSWLLAEAIAHPSFHWTARKAEDWRTRPPGWPETRYMNKGIKEERPASWFEFEKK